MPALKHTNVIFQISHHGQSDIYISEQEQMDLLTNLKPAEVKLYTVLKFSKLHNPTPDYFSDDYLAFLMGTSAKTVANLRSVLKSKGYAQLVKFKDERKNTMIKVIIGKQQVEVYNLGLDIAIQDAKAYRKIYRHYPDIFNADAPMDVRQKLIEEANKEYA